jgi:hypothetical protein
MGRFLAYDPNTGELSARICATPRSGLWQMQAAKSTFAAPAGPRSGFTLPGKANPPRDQGNGRTKLDLPCIARKIRHE